MNSTPKILGVALLCLWLPLSRAFTQQIAFPNALILRDRGFNPGHFPNSDHHQLRVYHQQRELNQPGWKAAGQFLHYQARPLAFNPRFSWGLLLSHDEIHTESQLALSPTLSVALVDDGQWQVATGISAGILAHTSNYQDRAIYDEGDPLFQNRSNFFELDAGLGLTARFQGRKLEWNGSIQGRQLPGNLITAQLPGLRIRPHVLARSEWLFSPLYNVNMGPLAFYRNTLNQGDTTIQSAQLDLGWKMEFERQRLWTAVAYRWDQSALTTGLGIEIYRTDTVAAPNTLAKYLDVNLTFSSPLQSGMAPSAEVGIGLKWGQPRRTAQLDSLQWARPFWKTETWMTAHKERYLAPNGPYNLEARQEWLDRQVYLTYTFPDLSNQYAGTQISLQDSLVSHLGVEWEGMDGLLNGLVDEVIAEALDPDTFRIRDPENLEALQGLAWVEFSCQLRDDMEGAQFGSGQYYEGEFDRSYGLEALQIDLVVDDRDTVLYIEKGKRLNYLQLAALKLYAMRSRFHHSFQRVYGDAHRLVYEEHTLNRFDLDMRTPIYCKKLRIVTNHPNQQVFQINQIDLKFVRYAQRLKGWNGIWISNDKGEEREARIDRAVSEGRR